MQPLIDADMIVYEAAFAGQDRETGDVYSFDFVAEHIDSKIRNICASVQATEDPILYLTGKGNFRIELAKSKPYKGKRPERPYHYKNAMVYLESLGAVVAEGLEADDLMAMEQTARPEETVICTRDKDLRQVPGWHYGWEHGLQPEFELQLVDEIGILNLIEKESISEAGVVRRYKEVKGTGLKFFYAQLIIGDGVDNIPGLPRGGPALAYKLLADTNTEGEMFNAVREAYRKKLGDEADEYLLEQARLLWMVRELDEEGKPVMWEFPNE